VGDKIIASNTDARLIDLSKMLEKNKSTNGESNESTNNSSPCEWLFYPENKNDEFYKNGYRIKLTHQKVRLKTINRIL